VEKALDCRESHGLREIVPVEWCQKDILAVEAITVVVHLDSMVVEGDHERRD
jgi:hypothetical protein